MRAMENGFNFALHLGCFCVSHHGSSSVVVMVFSPPLWEIYIPTVLENQHIFALVLGGERSYRNTKKRSVGIFGVIFCSPVMEVLLHKHVLNKGCTGVLKERQFINVNPIWYFIYIYLFI
eukprot:TRINITY_DN15745_c0_g4_i1.p1 TRINITY_DN15745_c0_g4~~TRINITY_DN15745_c0_g4_i1.p1  ORF type:complete len:120 (-),score=2.32 TRINITY_DN15745_c0_g4_i1:926-1285(-)